MPTKYDIFELMYSKGGSFKPKEIVKTLRRPSTQYNSVYKLLLELEKDRLIKKTKHGFQAALSKRNDTLYQIIRYCIANNINHNKLLDKNITKFISKAFLKKRFTIKNFKINPRTYNKYINTLSQNGLLIILSRKPLTATIPYNTFLRDLLAYFGHKTLIPKQKDDEYLPEIERELQNFKQLRKNNERKYQQILDKHEIRFIQHSLNLEGNPITLPETIYLLKEHTIPKDMKLETAQEVQNYQKAVEQMVKDSAEKQPLTKQTILNYHYLAMQHKPEIAGKIRTVTVTIKNNPHFKTAKPEEIEEELDALLNKYNTYINNKHTLKETLTFSSYLHNQFQYIHPFLDGNSRTTRLITIHLLRSLDIPIIDIPLGLLEEYLFCTKGAKKRDDKRLNQALQRIILYNLKTTNEQLQQ